MIDSTKSSMNLSETICESVEIIAKSLLDGVKYDQTIKCTIIDVSKADQGEYRVSNGSTIFTAYSSEKYTKDSSVYVLIPEGNYNNNKLITGKASSENEKPYNYVAPLDNFLNITGNLINADVTSLLANHPERLETSIYSGAVEIATKDFTRLGLKASFKSLLKNYDCIAGDYGLKVKLTCAEDKSLDPKENSAEYFKYLSFDIKDMIGNPYGYEAFFSQEKLFNITDLNNITHIDIWFYQNANFISSNKENPNIVYQSTLAGVTSNLPDNLFVQDIDISLGYDIASIDGDYVQIYTLDSDTYVADNTKAEDNIKNISLRWLHENETGTKYTISDMSSEDFEVRWYKYNFQGAAADEFSGVCWERLDTDAADFELKFAPDITKESQQIKAIILYGDAPKVTAHENWSNNDLDSSKMPYYYFDQQKKSRVLSSDKFKNTTIYEFAPDTRNIYRSNVLTFTNKNYVSNPVEYDILNGLSLQCYDYSSGVDEPHPGVHLVYDDFGNIKEDVNYEHNAFKVKSILSIEHGATEVDLQVKAINATIDDETAGKITWTSTSNSAIESITWLYPISNTMLKNVSGEWTNTGELCVTYQIDKRYTENKSDNWIKCIIKRNGIEYFATQQLYFGRANTMGSECAVQIVFNKFDQPAVTVKTEEIEDLGNTVKLVDESGVIFDASEVNGVSVKWSLIRVGEKPEGQSDWLFFTDSSETTLGLKPPDSLTAWSYIVKAVVSGWKNESSDTEYDLVAYYPIELRTNGKWEATVPNTIIYSSSGLPQYNSTAFELRYPKSKSDKELSEIWSSTWSVTVNEDNLPLRLKGIDGDTTREFKLMPQSFFVTTSGKTEYCYLLTGWRAYKDKDGKWQSRTAAGWRAPVVAYDSRYFSSTIDHWNEDVVVDEEGGKILAPMIAAGSKNQANQFSGVLMGDWTEDNTATTHTGLYGFGEGQMAFAFKDDGTAFIGKSGSGRIEFDGSKGIITSSSYETGLGMEIDLDAPYIKMSGPAEDYVYADNDIYINGLKILTDSTAKKNGYLSKTEYNNFHAYKIPLYYKSNGVYKEESDSDSFNSSRVYYKKVPAKFIVIDATTEEDTPIQVGDKLQIKWDGSVNAKDLHLEAKNSIDSNKNIILSTRPDQNPLKISNKFKVDWDGILFAKGADLSNGFLKAGDIVGSAIALGVDSDYENIISREKRLDEVLKSAKEKGVPVKDFANFYADDFGVVSAKELTLYGNSGIKLGLMTPQPDDWVPTETSSWWGESNNHYHTVLDKDSLSMGLVDYEKGIWDFVLSTSGGSSSLKFGWVATSEYTALPEEKVTSVILNNGISPIKVPSGKSPYIVVGDEFIEVYRPTQTYYRYNVTSQTYTTITTSNVTTKKQNVLQYHTKTPEGQYEPVYHEGTTYYVTGRTNTDYNFKLDESNLKFGYNGSGYNCTVNKNGTIQLKGNITAESGKIGGWYLGGNEQKRLQSSKENPKVFLDPNGVIFGSTVKIGSYSSSEANRPAFWVDKRGNLGIGAVAAADTDTTDGDGIISSGALGDEETSPTADNYKFFVSNRGEVKAKNLRLYDNSGIWLGLGKDLNGNNLNATTRNSYHTVLDKDSLSMGLIKSGVWDLELKANTDGNSSLKFGYIESAANYNFKLSDSKLQAGLSDEGYALTVSSAGKVSVKGEIKAESGNIGGWHLGGSKNKRLQDSSGDVFLDPSGLIFGSAIKVGSDENVPKLYIDKKGNMGIGPKYTYADGVYTYSVIKSDKTVEEKTSSTMPFNKDGYNLFIDADGSLHVTLKPDNVTIEQLDTLQNTLNGYTYMPKKLDSNGNWVNDTANQKKGLGAIIGILNSSLEQSRYDIIDINGNITTIKGNVSTAQSAADAAATLVMNLAAGTYTNPDGSTGAMIDHNLISAPVISGGSLSGQVLNISGVVREDFNENENITKAEVQLTSSNLFLWSKGPELKWDATTKQWYYKDTDKTYLEGFLSYDNAGAGNDNENKERIWLKSFSALKLRAEKGISLETTHKAIYCGSLVNAASGLKTDTIRSGDINMISFTNTGNTTIAFEQPIVLDFGTTGTVAKQGHMYGAYAPGEKNLTGTKGQIFFQLKS